MPRAHYNEQLAAMVQTAVDGTVDLARNVLTTCSTSWVNFSYMKENFETQSVHCYCLYLI